MLTLAIDTSTNLLSVALLNKDDILASIQEQTNHNQSELLMPTIQKLFIESNKIIGQLEKIAVAIGPGSYTGLRVGVTIAKTLGYTLNIPVVQVSSLDVMAEISPTGVAMINARRNTVFAKSSTQKEGHYDLDTFLAQLTPSCMTSQYVDATLANANESFVSEMDIPINKAVVLARIAEKKPAIHDIHALVPNYLRQTEAERNAALNG